MKQNNNFNSLTDVLKESLNNDWSHFTYYLNCESIDVFSYDKKKDIKHYKDNNKSNYLYFYFNSEESDIEYKINNDGFRSNNFVKLLNNNNHILVSGCSHTFGYSLPEEYTWPAMMNNTLKTNNLDFEIDNISHPGLDIKNIINNVYTFINKYGSPQYIIILFPTIARGFDINIFENNRIIPTINNDYFLKSSLGKKENIFKFYNTCNEIKNLEKLCEILNIKLIWSSWCPMSNDIFNMLKFKNFAYINKMPNDLKNYKNIKFSNKYFIYAEDGVHFGIYFNEFFSKFFYKEMIKNI